MAPVVDAEVGSDKAPERLSNRVVDEQVTVRHW
jgi:hypothetical protein